MGHLCGSNIKLIQRVRRLRGQLEGVERMLVEGKDCYKVLQSVAACRGAFNGLTRQMMLEHLEHHLYENPEASESIREASLEMKAILESYLK